MDTTGQQTHQQFCDLIVRHKALIENMCMRRASGDCRLCVELIQECYITLWKRMDSLRPDCTFQQEALWVSWQCRRAFSRHRFLFRTRCWEPIDPAMSDTLCESDSASLLDNIESYAGVLTPNELRAFELMVQGYTTDEIAHIIGIKTKSVIQLRYRIITKLRHYHQTDNKNHKQ